MASPPNATDTALACTAARWQPRKWAARCTRTARAVAKAPPSSSTCRPPLKTATAMSNLREPSSHRLLVVDDNPSIHEDFRKVLCPSRSRAGASVTSLAVKLFDQAPEERPAGAFDMDSAFQGQEALAMIQAAEQAGRPYSLAFIDVRMPPGWDGIET